MAITPTVQQVTTAGRKALNDMLLLIPPKDCEMTGIIIADFEEQDIMERATAWLVQREAVFNQSHTGVFWIKDEFLAVEFKLLFA
jgi:hypothetical protein